MIYGELNMEFKRVYVRTLEGIKTEVTRIKVKIKDINYIKLLDCHTSTFTFLKISKFNKYYYCFSEINTVKIFMELQCKIKLFKGEHK